MTQIEGRIAVVTGGASGIGRGIADWRWMIDVNLWGVIHGVTIFLPLLRANPEGGHIVSTGSMASFAPAPGGAAYAVTKFGIDALTEAMAAEFAEEGSNVHVTLLAPGTVHTNIANSSRNRPEGLAGGFQDVDIEQEEFTKELRWIDPIDAGKVVTRAIRNNDLYALTHPEWFEAIVAPRFRAITEAFHKYAPGSESA